MSDTILQLRNELYRKHTRKEISDVLGISENHVSRLLNKSSDISFNQYEKLKEMV